jgi:membrane fusion protein, multidrug efflux system
MEPEKETSMSTPREVPAESGQRAPKAPPSPRSTGRKVVLAILALLVVAGGVFGVKTVVFYAHHEETDDAQIEGHIDPVLPRVSGYVGAVLVDDNQSVAAGSVLVRIDPKDLQARLEQAEASRANARAAVAVARANVAVARTNVSKTADDLVRYAALRKKQEISQQQYDAARAASVAASAELEAALRHVTAAEAEVGRKQADLESARLQLSYATILAPVSGVVSKKAVEVGQFVQAGQPLLAIVQDRNVWVVANYKETQLRKMRVGQPATIEVDAYPSKDFHARVQSIAAATGAKFALLPPDNATGNFTKVVQRVPVKIEFTDPPDPKHPLRVGMNVTSIVTVD